MNDLGDDDIGVLDVLHELLETERNFYSIIRFLEGNTRNNVVAAHMRNMGTALHILRTLADRQPAAATATMVMNIDLSGNVLRNFLEPVPIVPTREQINSATETQVGVVNTTCAICQDTVTYATRLRACGHCFHATCIGQWFGVNPRCPVCRHDIRDPLTHGTHGNPNEGSSVHPHSG